MSTAGPNQATTAADGGNGAGGTASWLSVANAVGDNNTFATCSPPSAGDTTNYLDITNFGTFTGVADGDNIDGIQIELKCKGSTSGIQIAYFDLIYAGSPSGIEPGWGSNQNLSTTAGYLSTSGDPVFDYGFPTLTGADVKLSNFGVRIVFITATSGQTVSVDACRITLTGTFTGGGGGSPTTATPGVKTLTITRYAPTTRTPRTATPGVKSLAATKYAPTVSTPRLATIGIKPLVTARYAPAVTTPRLATIGTQPLAMTLLAPAVATPRLSTPGVQPLATARYAPAVTTPRLSTPGMQSLALISLAPSIALPKLVTPVAQSLAIACYAPAVATPRTALPGVQALSLTCYSLHVINGIVPGTASLTLTCYAPVCTVTFQHGGPVTSYASISPLVTSTASLQPSIADSSVLASQVDSSLGIRT